MKVYDIISEDEEVAEAPVGAIDRAKQAIGGVVSKGKRREGEVSKEANKVAKELKSKLQGAGVSLEKIPVDTFLNILDQTGYSQGAVQQVERFVDKDDPDATLTKKQAEQIILKQTQSASLSNQGSGIKKGKFAGGNNTDKNSNFKQGAKAAARGFKKGWQGSKSASVKSRKSSTKSKSKDLDKNKIIQVINDLSPEEKKKLGKLLK